MVEYAVRRVRQERVQEARLIEVDRGWERGHWRHRRKGFSGLRGGIISRAGGMGGVWRSFSAVQPTSVGCCGPWGAVGDAALLRLGPDEVGNSGLGGWSGSLGRWLWFIVLWRDEYGDKLGGWRSWIWFPPFSLAEGTEETTFPGFFPLHRGLHPEMGPWSMLPIRRCKQRRCLRQSEE